VNSTTSTPSTIVTTLDELVGCVLVPSYRKQADQGSLEVKIRGRAHSPSPAHLLFCRSGLGRRNCPADMGNIPSMRRGLEEDVRTALHP
jgi:hypothetical protein